jgi:LysW-gamma-L-lysine/LysW-L-ornithine aminotransferase
MMDAAQIQAIEKRYNSGVYAKRDIVIVRGEGALLYDDQGKAFIDCVGGQGVANLGYAHPAIVQAITTQAQTLITCPEMFYNDQRALLMEKLAEIAPTCTRHIFLCNSGAETIEAAVKFARLSTGRRGIVAAMRGFHGRTMGALSATWNKKYREPFEPLLDSFSFTPYNNPEKLLENVTEATAALMLEVVQGEGGVYPGSAEFLQAAQIICRELGALLIIDEVQTGLGRTGQMFAFQHFGLQPDLVCIAKSLAGGLPMGAVLMGDRVGDMQPGLHGTTFGGNPLACAAAVATLDTLQREQLPRRAAELGEYLLERLRGIQSPQIREVRGLGLMVGIEIKQKVAPYLQALMAKGVLALPAGLTTLRLLPPLVITRAQLDQVICVLEEVLNSDISG